MTSLPLLVCWGPVSAAPPSVAGNAGGVGRGPLSVYSAVGEAGEAGEEIDPSFLATHFPTLTMVEADIMGTL